MEDFRPGALVNAILYSILGILIFVAAFSLLDKLTPFQLWNEIVRDKNVAVAILMGAMAIGMCIIIAAAVH